MNFMPAGLGEVAAPPIPQRGPLIEKTESGRYQFGLPIGPSIAAVTVGVGLLMARKNSTATLIIGVILGLGAYVTARDMIRGRVSEVTW